MPASGQQIPAWVVALLGAFIAALAFGFVMLWRRGFRGRRGRPSPSE
jgi:hypothetical protein